ncbi:hypothetical protein RclHR1_05920005 [Rhizophagus clarus]|nr:hypothetical protein RclHR1_05920005 [Rhizophagus clarus]
MVPYKPEQRALHTATLIDNKLYILGGLYIDGSSVPDVGKDFFYLDVSVSFNTQNLLWNDLSTINTVPTHYGAASVEGGANNSTLFLYGGTSVTVMELVYVFDPQSNSWSIPKPTGGIPIKKRELTGIIDHKGIMYLWGGFIDFNTSTLNDMLILDTINLVWEEGSVFEVPTGREDYGAALLADNNIIYMGGFDGTNELALNEVYLYDTINNNWSTKVTSGIVPSGRDGFSAILGLDGQRVIIFGGTASVNSTDLIPQDSLYELNLINFEWSIPKVSGQIPESRMYHKANVVGNYMVVSFGDGYDQTTESDILLLDISKVDDYIWTNEFYPLPPLPPPPSPVSGKSLSSLSLSSSMTTSDIPSSATSPITTVIGAVIGSFFGGALLSFGGFYWYKNRRRNVNNQVEREIHNDGQEIVQPSKNEHIVINEPPALVVNKRYNQELIPIANNVHELQQEIQDLKQIILQNNKQTTNTMENNN